MAVLTGALPLCCASAWAVSQEFQDAHAQLITDDSFDFEYTLPPASKVDTQSSNAFWEFIAAIFSALGPFLKVLFWGIVIGVIAYILFLIVNEALKIKRNSAPKEKSAPTTIPAYQPRADDARILLDDVDRLAAQGRFDEAVHTLLLRSIQDIKTNRPRSVGKALTSREIGTLEILSLKAQSAFRRIGDLVEISHFGGNPLDAQAFQISRNAYQEFAFESGGSAAGHSS